ncbi:Enterochelin esterase [Planctomycetes bacterium Poly30]|uniref:Enterochelin esterase n=1 Tax=Saltatorellus ferox TaxID=2528018 RepID=A0A518ETU9_9BACT|nr:Enterochelin esterase [Planctomycetes bacterium Poly30]
MNQVLEKDTLDALLARIVAEGPAAVSAVEGGFPVVEGNRALFAYVGHADEVRLHHWIFGLESAQEFHRVHAEVWTLEIEIHDAARVEYKLEVVENEQRQLMRDPLNDQLARDPFGANSVATGPGYTEPWWALEDRAKRHGEVLVRQLRCKTFGDVRPLSIYLPPRYRETRRYPLLVCHDGLDYLEFAGLQRVLDNLIDLQEIPPLIVCCTQSPNRTEEYAANERHAEFIANEVLPLMEAEFSLLDGPSDRALMGASFGAVASLYTALQFPDRFGKLFLQSGSFAFTDIGPHGRGPVFDNVVQFVNRYRRNPTKPATRVFLSCGIYESLIVYNRSLLPMLQKTGTEAVLVESQDGHNWENWRDRLRDGLTWLFPGPLWMVYE